MEKWGPLSVLGGDVVVFLWGLLGGQVSALNHQLASQTMTTHPSQPAHMGQLVLQRENVFMAQDTCPSSTKRDRPISHGPFL